MAGLQGPFQLQVSLGGFQGGQKSRDFFCLAKGPHLTSSPPPGPWQRLPEAGMWDLHSFLTLSGQAEHEGVLKTCPGIINGAQSRPLFPIGGSLGLLIILFIEIISPNQDRSTSELQLISCVCIFQFHKKSCGADENSRSLRSAVEIQPVWVPRPLPSALLTSHDRGRWRVRLCAPGWGGGQ